MLLAEEAPPEVPRSRTSLDFLAAPDCRRSKVISLGEDLPSPSARTDKLVGVKQIDGEHCDGRIHDDSNQRIGKPPSTLAARSIDGGPATDSLKEVKLTEDARLGENHNVVTRKVYKRSTSAGGNSSSTFTMGLLAGTRNGAQASMLESSESRLSEDGAPERQKPQRPKKALQAEPSSGSPDRIPSGSPGRPRGMSRFTRKLLADKTRKNAGEASIEDSCDSHLSTHSAPTPRQAPSTPVPKLGASSSTQSFDSQASTAFNSATQSFDSQASNNRSGFKLSFASAPTSRKLECAGTDKCSAENAVIIFDWDDTLLPTTYLKQVVIPSLPPAPLGVEEQPLPSDSPFHSKLAVLARAVEDILREAHKVARVAIVTLASLSWVEVSARLYLPGINFIELLRELDVVVYPADKRSDMAQFSAPSEWDACKAAKRNAMSKCLHDIYSDNRANWNVLSVGDSTIEREALKECLCVGCKGRATCKTIKLRENRTAEQLVKELHTVLPRLRQSVCHAQDFDKSTDNFGWGLGSLLKI